MTNDFIDVIREQLPDDERPDAVRIALTTCKALGPHLAAIEARSLARSLPEGPAAALQREPYQAGLGRPELEARMSHELGVSAARAHELVAIVGAAIAERMDDEAEKHLADVEPSIRALFARSEGRAPFHAGAKVPDSLADGRAGSKSSIAEGRPGGRRPLADANPNGGQSDSIAASDDPRADRRLSSAEPDRTLARGEPPPED